VSCAPSGDEGPTSYIEIENTHNTVVRVNNQEAAEGETFTEMGISKMTHLQACQREDEEKRILRRNPKYRILEFYD
jgi:hypothetical protein